MYHRQTGRRHAKTPRPRTAVDRARDGSFLIAIDRVTHESFSEVEFNHFAQQVLNVVQRATAHRRRPHDRSVAALLVEEIPGDLWDRLKERAEHDAVVHGRGAARVHDIVHRLLTAYARIGLEAIEALPDRPLPSRC